MVVSRELPTGSVPSKPILAEQWPPWKSRAPSVEYPARLSGASYAIWWATLAIVVLVFVPLTIALLHRTLRAARSTQTYIAEMLVAGLSVADNTKAIASLDATTQTAKMMLVSASKIKAHSEAIAGILAERAQRDAIE